MRLLSNDGGGEVIPVSQAYKEKINSASRRFRPRVLMYLNGDNAPPVIFDHERVVSMQLLEESGADFGNPIGYVSANELSLTLNNSDRAFTPTNKESPFYGKLRPGIRVEAFIELEIEENEFESVPLGIFWTAGDWTATSNSVEASIKCYDRLNEIRNRDMPMFRVARHTTVKEMFETLFAALGLLPEEYDIDPALNQPVNIGWYPDGKVQDALYLLAVAGNCYVTADRHGVIRVKSNFATGNPVVTLTEDDQIIAADNPQKHEMIFNKVRVASYYPRIKDAESVLKIDEVSIPPGSTKLQNIKFTSGPVAEVTSIKLIGQNTEIASLEYGAWGITLEITNSGPEETISLEVFGKTVEATYSTYETQDSALVQEWGEKELSINNHLIQDFSTAKTYADALLHLVRDPYLHFTFDLRGDPAIEVGDIVRVADEVDKIGEAIVVPNRITITYDGGLEATVEARKPVLPYQWVFVSPGLCIYAPYGVILD